MIRRWVLATIVVGVVHIAPAIAAEGEWQVIDVPVAPDSVVFSRDDQVMRVHASVTGTLCKFAGELTTSAGVHLFELNVSSMGGFSQINFAVSEELHAPGGVQFMCAGSATGVTAQPQAKRPQIIQVEVVPAPQADEEEGDAEHDVPPSEEK